MRLQALTAALSQAVTSEQVADAILSQGLTVLRANAGCVAVLSDDRQELSLLGIVGAVPDVAVKWRRFPVAAPVPLAEAVRRRTMVVIETLAERLVRYPALEGVVSTSQDGAMVALPMVVRDDVLGSLGWGWPADRPFTDDDRAFLRTLAELCGPALDRARLYDRERAARERAERAEASLRESEQRLRAISDNLPLGAVYQVLGDQEGRRRFTYISGGVERLFGVTPAEVLADALALYGLVHEEDRQRLQADEEVSVRALAPFDCQFRSWTRSGNIVWVHARSAPRLLSTGELAWEGFVMDVTARKRAEEALHRERELLGTIIDKIPVMLTVYEPDTRVLRLNPAFEQTIGWSSQDAAGVSLMEQCYPDAVYRERVRQFMQSCRDGWMDIRMRTRDGRDLETSWANIRLSNGTQVGIGLDISDRKRYEKSLMEADRRKDEFLATLAHELRNPLAPLRNGLQVMKLAGTNTEAVEQARTMMERQLAQMVRLIDDLLDLSRITSGKLELRKERVELASIVQSAIEGSRPLIEASAHQLTVTLPPEPVHLDADPARLAQVFANLLTNATKYTDRGGSIGLTAERHDGEVVVSVKDTGIGISSEYLPQLFQMFSQVAPALERSQGGLGIGLSLVKGLVEMHGGRVEARSEGLGKGSEFVVHLPLAAPFLPPETQEPSSSSGVTPQPRRRILVADDNRDAADSLAILLRFAGHEVYAVHDGQEAVDAARWFRPDVALLDIGMPKLNGYDACRHIRQQPWGKKVFLIALTGWGQEEDKRRSQEAGFNEHLVKPVEPAALEKLLAGLKPDLA
jgi:PAS domain S-box-containing protein